MAFNIDMTKLSYSIDQITAMTLANLKARYRGTWTGFIWTVLNPVIMFGAQSFAFGYVLRLNIHLYGLFLLSGLLPWIFIASSLDMSCSVLVNNGRLLKSFDINPLVLLMSQILDNLINFGFAFLIILLPSIIWFDVPLIYLLFVPLPMLLILIGVCCLGTILSITQVFFRDLRFILTFVISVCFFLTPIFYSVDLIPADVRWLVKVNFLYHLILPFRSLFYDQSFASFFFALLNALCVDLVLLAFAALVWKKNKNTLFMRL